VTAACGETETSRVTVAPGGAVVLPGGDCATTMPGATACVTKSNRDGTNPDRCITAAPSALLRPRTSGTGKAAPTSGVPGCRGDGCVVAVVGGGGGTKSVDGALS